MSELVQYMDRAEDFVRTRFGDSTFEDPQERATRVLEEAIELCQVEDVQLSKVQHVATRVYERPVGEREQEVAGILFTLLAFCASTNIYPVSTLIKELDRCEALPIDHFKARHAEKIALGMSDAAVSPGLDLSRSMVHPFPPARPVEDLVGRREEPPLGNDEWRREL